MISTKSLLAFLVLLVAPALGLTVRGSPSSKKLPATNLKVEASVEEGAKKELPQKNPNGTYPTYPPDGPCATKPANRSCHGREVYQKRYLKPPAGAAPVQQQAVAKPAVAQPHAGAADRHGLGLVAASLTVTLAATFAF